MRQIIGGRHPFQYRQVSADEARQLFRPALQAGADRRAGAGRHRRVRQPLDEKPEISIYKHDTFEDLCRGPHVEHTGQIPADAFKLMSVAGAYWRGDEPTPCCSASTARPGPRPRSSKPTCGMLEEAKKRDHRKLGAELEIFIFDDEVGPGPAALAARGGVLIDELENLAKEMEQGTATSRCARRT
jgi:threonyl-tRNA synthetase